MNETVNLLNMTSRITSLHPSEQQIEAILEHMQQHPEMCTRITRGPFLKEKIKKKWQDLTPHLNKIGRSTKTTQQWIKYWTDKKATLNRKLKMLGSPNVTLTEIDKRMLRLFGMEFPLETFVVEEITGIHDHHPGDIIATSNLSMEVCSPNRVSGTYELRESEMEGHLLLQQQLTPGSPPPAAAASPAPPTPAPHSPAPPSPQPSAPTTKPPRAAPHQNTNGVSSLRAQARQSSMAGFTERFLRLEERRVELETRNAETLDTLATLIGQIMERDFDRERALAQGLVAVGEGLKLLAHAVRKDSDDDI